jgi:diaminopropionate ammonia-lyase
MLGTEPHLIAAWDYRAMNTPGGAADFIDHWGDPARPCRSAVKLRWVDPPADDRAQLFVPTRPPSPGRVVLTTERMRVAYEAIAGWPGYRATPLVALNGLARRLDLGTIWLKDETKRFGVGSFKALGAGYALGRVLGDMLSRALGRDIAVLDLLNGLHRERTACLTTVAATDGNHGRALAWASRLFGCRCTIFVPAQVDAGRRAAIADLGAEVVEVSGTYDDAVEVAALSAVRNGWIEISDTAHGGGNEVPLLVMEGYTTLVREIAAAGPGQPFTHVFLQAGVGAFAGAVLDAAASSPVLRGAAGIIMESNRAACVFASARTDALTGVRGSLATIMAGLACGVPSTIAFEIVRRRASAFLQIPDADALSAGDTLAEGAGADLPRIGETGIAGLAGLLAVCRRADWRRRLGLSSESTVLLVATDGVLPVAAHCRNRERSRSTT